MPAVADAGLAPARVCSHGRNVTTRSHLRSGVKGRVSVMVLALVLGGSGLAAAQQREMEIQPSSATLSVGQSVALNAMDNAGRRLNGVQWVSSNSSVATVTGNGVVTARAAGQATIRARSRNLETTVPVTVSAPSLPPDEPPTEEPPTEEPPTEEPPTEEPPTEEPPPEEPPSEEPPPPAGPGIWISREELMARPTSGTAWTNLLSIASKPCTTPDLTNQDDPSNVCVLAKALVYARTGDPTLQGNVVDALWAIVNSGTYNGYALSLGRELGTYAIAADLINLKAYDPTLDSVFRTKIRALLTTPTPLGGPDSLIECHEVRPNNWGTHCGASRAAVAAYLGDTQQLARVAQVLKGWLGDRAAYAGFDYGDLSWQCDSSKPVGVNPKGCTKDGRSIDGVLPDDQRRSGSFTFPPPKANYVYEALQGALMQAVILHRAGYDVFNWQDRALLRAFQWLHTQASFPAEGDDTWEPHLVNRFYNTTFPAPVPSRPGKNMGWTDWTHGR